MDIRTIRLLPQDSVEIFAIAGVEATNRRISLRAMLKREYSVRLDIQRVAIDVDRFSP